MKFGLSTLGFLDGNIILLIVIAALLILYPVFLYIRNRKEQDKQKNLIDGLKIGEYVITYSGVFGKIVEINEKEVGRFLTLETGEAHKNYVTVSSNAIYMIANNNPKVFDAEGNEVKTSEESVEPQSETEEVKKQKPENKSKKNSKK